MTSEDGVYQNICHLYEFSSTLSLGSFLSKNKKETVWKKTYWKVIKMTGHPCHQLMHIYNLNVGNDGMDGDWKTLGKK